MLVRNYEDVTAVTYGEGVQKRVVIGPKEGAPTFVMRVFDLAPGTSSPYHRHDWEHEVFVLNGKGVVLDEKSETPIEANDAIYIAPNEKHCLKNTGQDTLRFICVVPLRGEDTP